MPRSINNLSIDLDVYEGCVLLLAALGSSSLKGDESVESGQGVRVFESVSPSKITHAKYQNLTFGTWRV